MIAEEKCYRKATGGGPHIEFPLDTVDSDIIELLGEKRFEGLHAAFGGDKEAEYMEIVFENDDNETTINENNGDISNVLDLDDMSSVPDDINIGNDLRNDKTHTWMRYTPDMLKIPQSKSLNTGKENNDKSRKKPENPIVTKVSHWASMKAGMEVQKKNLMEEEHKLKMRLMQEKHDVEIAFLKEESQVKLDALKEENKIRIDILRVQKMQLYNNLNIATIKKN